MKGERFDWDNYPLVLSTKHLADIMGIGMNSVYKLVHSEGFPVVRVGRDHKVPRDSFRKWLEGRANNE